MAPILTSEQKPYQQRINEQKQNNSNRQNEHPQEKVAATQEEQREQQASSPADGATVVGGLTGFALGGPILGVATAAGANAGAKSIQNNIDVAADHDNGDNTNQKAADENQQQQQQQQPILASEGVLDEMRSNRQTLEEAITQDQRDVVQNAIGTAKTRIENVNNRAETIMDETKNDISEKTINISNQASDELKSGGNKVEEFGKEQQHPLVQSVTDSVASGAEWAAEKLKMSQPGNCGENGEKEASKKD